MARNVFALVLVVMAFLGLLVLAKGDRPRNRSQGHRRREMETREQRGKKYASTHNVPSQKDRLKPGTNPAAENMPSANAAEKNEPNKDKAAILARRRKQQEQALLAPTQT